MGIEQHLDKIKAFSVVAEAGKLNEAAKRLHLSQPSLTRLIQTLEDACGQKLFYRSRRGVTLTQAGQLLKEYSALVLLNLENLEMRLKNPEVKHAGLLRIGSYESLAEYLWPDFVLHFKKIAPELKLSIKTSGIVNSASALEAGQVDLMVDAEPRVVGDFTSWVLYEDRFDFFAAPGKFDLENDPNSMEAIPLIYCPQATDHENKGILHHLEEKGFSFKEKMELDSFTAVRTFCEKGLGIGVLPQRLAKKSVQKRQISPIKLKGFSSKGFGSHSICVTVLSSRTDDSKIKLLTKALKEQFKRN